MSDITDFSMPVHKSFHQPDLLLGVPKGIFIILFLIMVIVWYLFGWMPAVAITILVYIPCFLLTKHDPFMLTIAINSLIEPDRLEG